MRSHIGPSYVIFVDFNRSAFFVFRRLLAAAARIGGREGYDFSVDVGGDNHLWKDQ